jgi:hypothetical protein
VSDGGIGGLTNGSIAPIFAGDRAALHREVADVAFHDFES